MNHSTFLRTKHFCFALALTFLWGCANDRANSGALNQQIRSFLEDDQGITASECGELRNLIANDPALQRTLGTPEQLTAHIDAMAEKMSKGRRAKISYPIEIACDEGQTSQKAAAYNFYIENSGSMYGYMGDNTAFDDVVLGLMTKINRYDEEINMFFVNDKIHPVQEKFQDFMDYLDPNSLRKLGNTRSSNIADVLKLVVEQQAEDEKAAIILSDFIFSISDHNNVRSELTDQKYGITNIIHNNRLKEKGLGFLIMKFNSDFEGNYFRFDNTTVKLNNDRPYYVWVIDQQDRIQNFVQKYEVNRLKEFEEDLIIYSSADKPSPYYSILKSTDGQGRFNLIDRGGNQPIKAIKDIQYSTRGEKVFQFSLAFDASSLPVSEDYLSNPANYQLSSDMEDVFEIVEVKKVNNRNVSTNDRGYQGSATHYLVLSSTEISAGKQQLDITLLKNLPAWIAESSTIDDRNIGDSNEDLSKTFGFQDLMEGVAEDFKPRGGKIDKYFSLSLELER